MFAVFATSKKRGH